MSATVNHEEGLSEASMNAMIIYEERDFARRASALLQRASDRADAATRWRVNPWRLDMLRWPPTAPEALRDAVESHLLVLALRHPTGLPRWLAGWLETWAARREVQEVALAVFDGQSGDTLSATATPELAAFAQRHGLSFILGDGRPVEDESAELWKGLHEREVAQTPTMAHILGQQASGNYWGYGINE
jgi:hypothetical protein